MDRSVIRGAVLIVVALAVVGLMFLLPGTQKTPKSEAPPNLDPWTLISNNPGDPYGTYLANGFISTRVKGDGVGSQGGKPLPCFMSGLYNDEKLVTAPTWSDLRFYLGSLEFRIDENDPYEQRLQMRSGLLLTTATWRAGSKTLRGTVEIVVSRAQPNAGMVFAVLTPSFDGSIRVEAPIGDPNERWRFKAAGSQWWQSGSAEDGQPMNSGVWTTPQSRIPFALAMAIRGDSPVKAAKPASQPASSVDIKVRRESKFMVFSYAALATGPDPASARDIAVSELNAAIAAKMDFVKQHKAAWEKLWEKDIVIDGPKKDQQALHSCMFYLLQSVREGSQWSIPPMGLSDNAFAGHVFWDADLWMFPALILQHPKLARAIVDYRYNTLQGAVANAKLERYPGAQYAWESGYTGKEDTPPHLVYRHERHINGDVALAQWQYYLATGDLNWLKSRGLPVIEATADYWVGRATFVEDKNRYEIHQVVPPDENAERVDNSAYTNCIARLNLDIATRAAHLAGRSPNPRWAEVSAKMYIPIDMVEKRLIAHDDYRGFEAKQADTELVIYPLQCRIGGEAYADIYKGTFGFYAPKVMKNGPAMSSSAHAVIAARLGDSKQAYADFVNSYKPFLRGPFNYFNEKRSRTYENMCFLTGAAGPIQAALFGLAGVRMDYFSDGEPNYAPCLPSQWNAVRITGVEWRGKTFDLVVSKDNKVEMTNVRSLR